MSSARDNQDAEQEPKKVRGQCLFSTSIGLPPTVGPIERILCAIMGASPVNGRAVDL